VKDAQSNWQEKPLFVQIWIAIIFQDFGGYVELWLYQIAFLYRKLKNSGVIQKR